MTIDDIIQDLLKVQATAEHDTEQGLDLLASLIDELKKEAQQ